MGRRVEVDRLAFGRDRAGRVGRIERVRHQDRRLARTRTGQALRRNRRKEQALARAAEHENLVQRFDRAGKPIAPVEPAGHRLAVAIDAGVARIAAELLKMRRQHRPDEGRDRMLRLADRDVDRRHARLDAGQEVGQPHERRACVGDPSGGGAFGNVHEPLHGGNAPPHVCSDTIGGGRLRRD